MTRPLALITGASSGIGRIYALRLAQRGHNLILMARRKDLLEALAGEAAARHGVTVDVLPVDLASDEGQDAAVAAIERAPALSALVHSAGFGTRGHFADVGPGKIQAMVRLHDLAAVRLIRAAVPAMRRAGRGDLVLISSLAAFFTTAEYTLYSASKAFLNMLAQGLAAELTGSGLRVQAVCPGLVRTGFMQTEEYANFSYDRVPGLAWLEPEEVVDQAMASLDRGGPLVFVPGGVNRALARALSTPGLGWALRSGLNLASRKFGSLF